MEFAKATQRHTDYQNRHITQLKEENEKVKTENKLLAANILKWTDRASANKLIRTLSGYLQVVPAEAYKIVYDESITSCDTTPANDIDVS
jgi:hypothetical protein